MIEILMWMLFGGFILTAMLYLAFTTEDKNDKQQH